MLSCTATASGVAVAIDECPAAGDKLKSSGAAAVITIGDCGRRKGWGDNKRRRWGLAGPELMTASSLSSSLSSISTCSLLLLLFRSSSRLVEVTSVSRLQDWVGGVIPPPETWGAGDWRWCLSSSGGSDFSSPSGAAVVVNWDLSRSET